MAKTELTKKLESLLFARMDKRKEFGCHEVTIGWYGKEIVDFISYSTDREIKCREIKVSKQDFYSKAAVTFIGNKNYYVMPTELYEQVKNDIPNWVGVYGNTIDNIMNGHDLKLLKNARRQELKADKEVILSSMLRSMQREVLKYKH